MKEDQLTPWFPAEVKPVHVGRYSTANPWTEKWTGNLEEGAEWYWDGSQWVNKDGRPSCQQNRRWRGLRSKP